jgi:hypothetical protein
MKNHGCTPGHGMHCFLPDWKAMKLCLISTHVRLSGGFIHQDLRQRLQSQTSTVFLQPAFAQY